MELVRNAAGKQLLARVDTDLKAALPPAITTDSHLLFKILSESSEKRRMGMLLNPPALNPNDDVSEILEEAQRRAQLLDDLLQGREIFPDSQPVAA